MVGKRSEGALVQHADCCLRTHADVDDLRTVGMGHGRRRPGDGLPEAVRLGHRAEWTYPSDRVQGGGEYHFSYRALDRLSATDGGEWPWAYAAQGGERSACQHAWRDQHQDLASPAQGHAFRLDARLIAITTYLSSKEPDHAICHLSSYAGCLCWNRDDRGGINFRDDCRAGARRQCCAYQEFYVFTDVYHD